MLKVDKNRIPDLPKYGFAKVGKSYERDITSADNASAGYKITLGVTAFDGGAYIDVANAAADIGHVLFYPHAIDALMNSGCIDIGDDLRTVITDKGIAKYLGDCAVYDPNILEYRNGKIEQSQEQQTQLAKILAKHHSASWRTVSAIPVDTKISCLSPKHRKSDELSMAFVMERDFNDDREHLRLEIYGKCFLTDIDIDDVVAPLYGTGLIKCKKKVRR